VWECTYKHAYTQTQAHNQQATTGQNEFQADIKKRNFPTPLTY